MTIFSKYDVLKSFRKYCLEHGIGQDHKRREERLRDDNVQCTLFLVLVRVYCLQHNIGQNHKKKEMTIFGKYCMLKLFRIFFTAWQWSRPQEERGNSKNDNIQ